MVSCIFKRNSYEPISDLIITIQAVPAMPFFRPAWSEISRGTNVEYYIVNKDIKAFGGSTYKDPIQRRIMIEDM